MEASTNDESHRTIQIIRYGKRLFSQTPMPSNSFVLNKIVSNEENFPPMRKKRAASEQFYRRDR